MFLNIWGFQPQVLLQCSQTKLLVLGVQLFISIRTNQPEAYIHFVNKLDAILRKFFFKKLYMHSTIGDIALTNISREAIFSMILCSIKKVFAKFLCPWYVFSMFLNFEVLVIKNKCNRV